MQFSLELISKIEKAIQNHQFDVIEQHFDQINDADIAKLLSDLSLSEQVTLVEHLPNAAYILEFLSLDQQLKIAEHLPKQNLIQVLSQMHSDDQTDLFKYLPYSLQQSIYTELSPEIQQQIQHLAKYPEESAGAIMSSDYVAVSPELNITQAIEQIRKIAKNRETVYLIYVVDPDHKLLGVASLREMILADPNQNITDVMRTDLIMGDVNEDQESIAEKLHYYDFIALPIVDQQQRLVGIVTYDDAMDIATEEATEDFLKSSAVTSSPKMSIKTAPIHYLYKKRVFWLVILVFGSLLSGFGIAHFEDIIAKNIVLVFFLPLLVGSGGNAGSQSATLMVRALATGDVHLKDWLYLIGRESLVGLCLGGTMAIAVSILGYFRGDAMVALVLALSMMGIVLMGCLIGMSLPFILNRLKLDPASASAPLVTSICDATGVIVYLCIASIIL
ncbi:magnesium transporter [Acinetobacter bereziniae]|jgi:magnesium transporter|uniref:Magnesium transporter MgtE n=2 Tax=Acinetobacter bereziniae TaxID=106648 RepID=N9DG13_ACIBZ|nr:magnesium transporter [Acinetobacter bereziniae]ENV97137.1 magnesium transporter [Acinetobacter bereziniae LMG 1003 = CIP 70.12]MBI0393122.1 magnesium transporter [Acinetobacter bereziniae]MBJ9905747.1 magnesium transporter [Acinetobacter bereziniae]MBJ9927380.1 magnesium transporter [Acinetobacter bereziniae]MCU4317211.1 magnesium transporter [Acinetobacter bereziniae]